MLEQGSAPIPADPNIPMAAAHPMASDPKSVRVRPNDIMSTDPNPATADADGPIARRPDVFRARSDRYHFNLRYRRSLSHDGSVSRRWRWGRRSLRCNRRSRGVHCLREWSLIGVLRCVSVAGRGLVNGCSLVSRDIFRSPFGAPGGYRDANGGKGQ